MLVKFVDFQDTQNTRVSIVTNDDTDNINGSIGIVNNSVVTLKKVDTASNNNFEFTKFALVTISTSGNTAINFQSVLDEISNTNVNFSKIKAIKIYLKSSGSGDPSATLTGGDNSGNNKFTGWNLTSNTYIIDKYMPLLLCNQSNNVTSTTNFIRINVGSNTHAIIMIFGD